MKAEILNFFSLHRHIFGVCPKCEVISRLSECDVYVKARPTKDWLDKINDDEERLDRVEEKLEEKLSALKELGREKGRQQANRIARKIDRVFTPRKLSPDDAKVIFHPIDYLVFNGMKAKKPIRNLILLDRKDKSADRKVQRSIEKAVEKGRYEWLTLRVGNDGSITSK